MTVSYNTFERLKDKGLAHFKNGEYAAAKPYLMQAADAIIKIAGETDGGKQRDRRKAMAAELIEFAKLCDQRQDQKRTNRRAATSEDGDSKTSAQDWIVREKTDTSFADIAGLDDVKHEIQMKMIFPFRRPDLAKQYGIGVGGGLLLYGPPGTGKTMIAKAIANEIEATMFVISPAQILSKWVGEAEQNIAKLFKAAKEENKSVIFIDEIEALVPARRSSQSTVMTRVVPQILQEIEGFDRKGERPLLFLGATNEPWALDSAMMRPGRFDSKIYVPLPDEPARHKLLEIYFGKKPMADDVDFVKLVGLLDGYSGADIKAIAGKSATIPFMEAVGGGEPREITLADILTVIEIIKPSVRTKDLARFREFADAT
jgi:transitional endoplasmic reticulum ATPase